MGKRVPIKDDFTTLTQWHNYMKGRQLWIVDPKHKYYEERLKYSRMQGRNDLITHPDNNNGWAVRLIAVRLHNDEEVPLLIGQFLIC